MFDELLDKLDLAHGATLGRGYPPTSDSNLEFARLPPDHKHLLKRSNGIEVFDGFYRIFGIGPESLGIDASLWNREDYWKFAWRGRATKYWCFGESAWGDQFAYLIDELIDHSQPRVYWLDGFAMQPRLFADSFAEFLKIKFLRFATSPYDSHTLAAHEKFGRLDPSTHVTFFPPLVIDNQEDMANAIQMPARAAMICNGDAAAQLDDAPDSARLARVEVFEDERARTRLKLIWSQTTAD